MDVGNLKLLYASGPRGLRATIPLVRTGAYDTADIYTRLKNAGFTDQELTYVVFSPQEPPVPATTSSAAELPPAPTDNQPEIPVPSDANANPPLYSAVGPLTSVKVTPDWRQLTGCRYSMKRADGAGYVAVQDLSLDAFENPDDYHKINDGRIQLAYGLVWRRAALHFLKQGDRWDETVTTTHGMSRTDSMSITASVGYSGGGASASLSATYSLSITVNDQTQVQNDISVAGVAGESQTAALWELCREYVLVVDGTVRGEDNPFQVIYTDKGGRHMLLDTWGPTFEVVSALPTLKSTIFKT